MQTHSTLINTSTQSDAHTTHVTQLFAPFHKVCATPLGATADIITVVFDEKNLLGKQFSLNAAGEVEKKAAVSISRGIACQFYVPDLDTLEAVLRLVSENPHAAIINSGWRPVPVGKPFVFISKKTLKAMNLEEDAITTDQGMQAFARLKVHATPSSWQVMDRDEDKFTPDWAKKQSFEEWCLNVAKIFPGFDQLSMLGVGSSSVRVLLPDGTPVGGGNSHWFFMVDSPNDVERARAAIPARALQYELAWKKPHFSKTTGEECASGFATIIDASVWTPGRLLFEGSPSVTGNLRIAPQKFERIVGTIDALDTSLATINEFETKLASIKQGIKLGLTLTKNASGKVVGCRSILANLTMETELELEDGSIATVRELMKNYHGKVRCQAFSRFSTSMAAFFVVNKDGEPSVFDSGTDTMHVLAQPTRKPDPDCDQLVREIRRALASLLRGEANAEMVLDEEQLRTTWDLTFFSTLTSKIILLNKHDQLIELSIKDAVDFGFQRDHGRFFDYQALKRVIMSMKLDAKEAKDLHNEVQSLEYSAFIEMVKLYKQAKSLALSVDIFAKRGSMSVVDGVATIKLPHRPLVPKLYVDSDIVNQVVADYVQHFPEFQDFIDLVLHARFATDRRQAFVWLHAASSWGKGFLQSIFANLGLVVDVSIKEIEKIMEGSPAGLDLSVMLRPWIMFVDEFKAASGELKLLNTQISLSPKFQLRMTVPLYTKLFASAENVRSLVGDGVESQYNNRFAYLFPSSSGQKLEDRPLLNVLGKEQYIGALSSYVADVLNKGVENLRALGPMEASRVADQYLKSYQAAHRLDATFGNLDETVDDLVDEIKQCLIDYAYWIYDGMTDAPPLSVQGIGTQLLNTLKRTAAVGYVSKGEHAKERNFAIVLPDAEKFIKNYIALSNDRSTVGKMQYKCDIIAQKMHMRFDAPKGKFRVYSSDELGHQIAYKRGIVVFG